MNVDPAVWPDKTLAALRFYVPAQPGHAGVRGAADADWRGRHREDGPASTLVLPLAQVRLLSLFDLPEHVGPVLFRADRRYLEHRSSDLTAPDGAGLLHRIDGWSHVTARAFAIACAERALPLLEWHAPDDDRPARMLAAARSALAGHPPTGWRHQMHEEARAYLADIAEHSCHPGIMPAARACAATVHACTWGAVRAVVVNAGEAEAHGIAWDAAWSAARDAAWFACTAAETDARSAAAWDRTWAHAILNVRTWQAVTLARYLGLTD